MNENPSRREFMKIGCGVALAGLAACSGATILTVQAPPVQYIENHFEGVGAVKKILVAYATKAGSTAQVADAIGQTLSTAGASVDVRPIKKVTELRTYDSIVLGSAIRFGQWLPEAAEFVKSNQGTLRKVPTAFFTVHILSTDDSEASRKKRQAYTEPVRKVLVPTFETFFSGKVDLSQLSFFEQLMAKAVSSPVGDFRDWKAIQAWAQGLYPSLA